MPASLERNSGSERAGGGARGARPSCCCRASLRVGVDSARPTLVRAGLSLDAALSPFVSQASGASVCSSRCRLRDQGPRPLPAIAALKPREPSPVGTRASRRSRRRASPGRRTCARGGRASARVLVRKPAESARERESKPTYVTTTLPWMSSSAKLGVGPSSSSSLSSSSTSCLPSLPSAPRAAPSAPSFSPSLLCAGSPSPAAPAAPSAAAPAGASAGVHSGEKAPVAEPGLRKNRPCASNASKLRAERARSAYRHCMQPSPCSSTKQWPAIG